MIRLSVVDWAAWAPGLESRASWQDWAASPRLPLGDDTPALAEVPAMQRRRIERLGRMAIQAVLWCEASAGTPLVFASRHGDVARSLGLLETLADGEPMSPTGFSLSVHNAVAALHSILRSDRANYLALAAGNATMEAAWLEAAALLADGAPEVRVIAYDLPLPEAYAACVDGPEAPHACCWQVAPEGDARVLARLGLSWESAGAAPATQDGLPSALEMQRFLLSGDASCERVAEGRRWRWRRHG